MMFFRAVIDVDTLVLVVTVDTEKLEVNVPSPSAVDTGSYLEVITTAAETIGGKSNANLLIFSFPTWHRSFFPPYSNMTV